MRPSPGQRPAERRRSLRTRGVCDRNDGLKRDPINFLPELRRSVLPSSSLPRGGMGSPGQAGRTKSQEMAASALRWGQLPAGEIPPPEAEKENIATAGGRGFKGKKKKRGGLVWFGFFSRGKKNSASAPLPRGESVGWEGKGDAAR